MSRVKRGVVANAKHKSVLAQAKGYRGARSRVYRVAKQAVIKAAQYAYRDRKKKKIYFRSLWIQRINASVREHGLSYSRFMCALKELNIVIDRKILAHIACEDSKVFDELILKAKQHIEKAA